MDKVIYWEVFENTGSIEAYLTYCKAKEVFSDSPAVIKELEEKSFDGEK